MTREPMTLLNSINVCGSRTSVSCFAYTVVLTRQTAAAYRNFDLLTMLGYRQGKYRPRGVTELILRAILQFLDRS